MHNNQNKTFFFFFSPLVMEENKFELFYGCLLDAVMQLLSFFPICLVNGKCQSKCSTFFVLFNGLCKYQKHLLTRSGRCKHQNNSNQTSKCSNKTEKSQNIHCNRLKCLSRTSWLYRPEEEDSCSWAACSHYCSWCCQLCGS